MGGFFVLKNLVTCLQVIKKVIYLHAVTFTGWVVLLNQTQIISQPNKIIFLAFGFLIRRKMEFKMSNIEFIKYTIKHWTDEDIKNNDWFGIKFKHYVIFILPIQIVLMISWVFIIGYWLLCLLHIL